MTGIFGKEFQYTITRLSRNFGVDIGKGSTAVNGKTEFVGIGHEGSIKRPMQKNQDELWRE